MSHYVYASDVYTRSHGLGAVTRNGFTVDYYADPATLKFKDRNMKKLYEDLRNADVDFQKMMNDVARSLRPVLGTVEFVSGGKLKAADLEKLFRVKLPTSGMAVFLEVACGGRPLDQGFQAVGQMLKQDLEGAAATFGIIGGLSAAVSSTALIPGPQQLALAGVAAVLVNVAAIAIPAAGLCGIVAVLLGSLIKGQLPSKKDFGDSLKAAARLAGSPEPSQAEINSAYKGLKDANDVAKALKQDTPSGSPTPPPAPPPAPAIGPFGLMRPALLAPRFTSGGFRPLTTSIRPSFGPSNLPPPPPEDKPDDKGFPVLPVALAAGVVAFLLLRK